MGLGRPIPSSVLFGNLSPALVCGSSGESFLFLIDDNACHLLLTKPGTKKGLDRLASPNLQVEVGSLRGLRCGSKLGRWLGTAQFDQWRLSQRLCGPPGLSNEKSDHWSGSSD
jgi:hypothetical protein